MYPELTRDEVFMIGTKRLWLRWPRPADAERLAAINGHPDVAPLTASWPLGCEAEFARARIMTMRDRNAAGTALTLAIADRRDFFGVIGLLGIGLQDEPDVGHLGYALDPACHGRGLMTEALTGLIDMTRLLTRMSKIEAAVVPHNRASMRVLEKLGFERTKPGVYDSPIKGPIDVVGYERLLRSSARSPHARQTADQPWQSPDVRDAAA